MHMNTIHQCPASQARRVDPFSKKRKKNSCTVQPDTSTRFHFQDTDSTLIVPDTIRNLLSVRQMQKSGHTIILGTKTEFQINSNIEHFVPFIVCKTTSLWVLPLLPPPSATNKVYTTPIPTLAVLSCKCLGKWHTNCRSLKTRSPKLQTNAKPGYWRNHQNSTRQTNEINLLSCLHCSQDAQAESTYFSIIRLPTTRTLGGHLYGSIRQIVLKALTDFNIWWYLSIHMQEPNMSIFWHQHWISCMPTSAWHRTSENILTS